MSDSTVIKRKPDRFLLDILGIKIKKFNIKYIDNGKTNPDVSHRFDCTTRSLSRVLNIPYYDILKMQLERAIEYSIPRANYLKITEDILKEYGYSKIKVKKQTAAQFMYEHKEGRYVIFVESHAFAYINGTWYDNDHCFAGINNFLTARILCAYGICDNQEGDERE